MHLTQEDALVNLRIPGPTACPPDVLESLSGQMMNHRGPEFGAILERVTEGLRPFLATENDILILTCSGSGVMEAAVVNTLSPEDNVLAVSIGAFGDRFGQIAEAYGANVTPLDFEWGSAADPATIADAVRDTEACALLLTHNETSTGVTNPLQEICAAAREANPDILILVDAVSSAGCIPVEPDNWGIDVLVTGSQKGWQVPPGLAMAVVGPRAWDAYETARMPRFYLDFGKAREFVAKGQTPFTPAVTVFYGLDLALRNMANEGTEATYARHQRIAAHCRRRVEAIGLDLFADPRFASNTVTAVRVPDGIDGADLSRLLRTEYDTVIAGGQAALTGKIFRIGHLGWVDQAQIDAALDALGDALAQLGYVAPARD